MRPLRDVRPLDLPRAIDLAPAPVHTFAMPRFPLACLLALALAGCATAPAPVAVLLPAPAAGAQQPVVVPERYVSEPRLDDELDSLATWPTTDGRTWLIATAKKANALEVFDAESGVFLRQLGGPGSGPGEFSRPNGITVFGNLVFVVERDNHRVQVLALPDLTPVGMFGADTLRSPYGIWLQEIAPDTFEAYVTDSFMDGAARDVVPPLEQLARRVHRFRIVFDDDGSMRTRNEGTFGSTDAAAALHMVESIAGDPATRRLLIADEYRGTASAPRASTLREYDFDGRPTGRAIPDGTFSAEAEGVALWSCGTDSGYWVAVDQLEPLTRFFVFDRETLALRGTFTGDKTAYTDGIALHAAATPGFPAGALYAVHNDGAVAAFDLGDVARALALDPRCAG